MTERIDLKDAADTTSSHVHYAYLYINPVTGTLSIDLYRHGETLMIGGVLIEQYNGELKLRLWTNAENDDPSFEHNFSDDHPGFCMICGAESGCEHGA